MARSWTAKWGDALHAPLRRVAREEDCDHWLAERMPPERRRLVAEIFHDDLSIPSSAALRWVLRNELFFDLDLPQRSDRVLPLRYEDLVGVPEAAFGALFDFLELPFDARYVADVAPRPKVRRGSIEIDPRVRECCEELSLRLLRAAPPLLREAPG